MAIKQKVKLCSEILAKLVLRLLSNNGTNVVKIIVKVTMLLSNCVVSTVNCLDFLFFYH